MPNINSSKEYGRIYKLFNILDITKFYIGSTIKNINDRLGDHKSASRFGSMSTIGKLIFLIK